MACICDVVRDLLCGVHALHGLHLPFVIVDCSQSPPSAMPLPWPSAAGMVAMPLPEWWWVLTGTDESGHQWTQRVIFTRPLQAHWPITTAVVFELDVFRVQMLVPIHAGDQFEHVKQAFVDHLYATRKISVARTDLQCEVVNRFLEPVRVDFTDRIETFSAARIETYGIRVVVHPWSPWLSS